MSTNITLQNVFSQLKTQEKLDLQTKETKTKIFEITRRANILHAIPSFRCRSRYVEACRNIYRSAQANQQELTRLLTKYIQENQESKIIRNLELSNQLRARYLETLLQIKEEVEQDVAANFSQRERSDASHSSPETELKVICPGVEKIKDESSTDSWESFYRKERRMCDFFEQQLSEIKKEKIVEKLSCKAEAMEEKIRRLETIKEVALSSLQKEIFDKQLNFSDWLLRSSREKPSATGKRKEPERASSANQQIPEHPTSKKPGFEGLCFTQMENTSAVLKELVERKEKICELTARLEQFEEHERRLKEEIEQLALECKKNYSLIDPILLMQNGEEPISEFDF